MIYTEGLGGKGEKVIQVANILLLTERSEFDSWEKRADDFYSYLLVMTGFEFNLVDSKMSTRFSQG